MAEVTGLRSNALNYPVYGAPYGVTFPILDADGDLVTGAASLDSEISKNGDTFGDCTNEATEIATSSGMYYLLLTAAELTTDVATVIVKTATAGAKTTPLVLYPRKLVTLRSGTAAGGAAGSITLDSGAAGFDDAYNGCLVVGTLDSNVEARIITDYTGSSKVAAVVPDWVTTPDSDDTFIVYLPEGMQIPQADVRAWIGTAVATPTVAGVPEVDVTHISGSAVSTTTAQLGVNVVQISTDATAADNLETMLDGTGGQTLSLGKLAVVAAAGVDAVVFTAGAASGATPAGAAIRATGGAASTTGGGVSGPALVAVGGAGAASTNGAAHAITATGGGTTTVSGGVGAVFTGTGEETGWRVQGATDAAGAEFLGGAPNGDGVWFRGVGTSDGGGVGIFTDGHHGIVGVGNDDTGRGAYFVGSSTGAGGAGLLCQGGLAGPGILGLGGDTGIGIQGQGGVTSGPGIEGLGQADHGFHAQGGAAGAGAMIEAVDTGRGLDVRGGATSGEAALFLAQAGNSDAILVQGFGTGAGVHVSGGASGNGISLLGGSVTGEALRIESLAGASDGVLVIGAAGGFDINAPNSDIGGVVVVSGTVTTVTGNVGGNVTGSVGSVAAGGITSASIATGAVDADALATDAVNEIADGILGRNVAGGSSIGRTVKEALYFLRNKWTVATGTLTVYETDDATPSWTASVSSDAAADPIVGNDPS